MTELELLASQFAEHVKTNEQIQAENLEHFKSISTQLAEISSKSDRMFAFMKNVDAGISIFKFSWNNASKIGSFLVFAAGVLLFIKYGILGVVAWFFTSRSL